MLMTFMPLIAQDNVIDQVLWVVGDEAILKSDVEQARLYYMMQGKAIEGDPYCVIPEQLAIQKLFSENKIAEAQAIQKEANRIITLLCKFGVMQAEKEVLNQLGIDLGECRKPFGVLTDEQKAIVAKEIIPYVKGVN